ncbi:F-box/LRR-repeat protein 6 isoform 6-T6 [Liasis olivaceus]
MRRGGGPAPLRGRRRRRRRRGSRGAPRFVVHETEEAALLLVPAAGERGPRGPRRRRRAAAGDAPGGEGAGGADSGWGARLPAELLVRVLGLAVASEGGAVPLLCRAARVCRLWYRAASAPVLWRTVAVGHCWAPAGQRWAPALQRRALGTLEWLAARRCPLLRDFALGHWRGLVAPVLQAIGASCPLLASLRLSHCSGVTAEALRLLAESCPRLVSLNLQGSQVDSWAVTSFLEVAGARMRQLSLTYSSRIGAIIALLAVLRLLNVTYYPKPLPSSAAQSLGFPQLEELCLATTAFSFVDNNVLWRILCASSRLRVLDLRGCVRVTPKGLERLPCPVFCRSGAAVPRPALRRQSPVPASGRQSAPHLEVETQPARAGLGRPELQRAGPGAGDGCLHSGRGPERGPGVALPHSHWDQDCPQYCQHPDCQLPCPQLPQPLILSPFAPGHKEGLSWSR